MEVRAPEQELDPDPETDPNGFYHAHEEDSVPENAIHEWIDRYARDVLEVHQPGRWVSGDLCCYWIRGNNRRYLAPDVFVAERAPAADAPRVSFLLWEHGPLHLVIEIGSRSSFRQDVGPKLERYAEGLKPQEYLYFDADLHRMHLHRRTDLGYREVQPNSEGRLWSEAVQVWFRMEPDGTLRILDAEGSVLPSHRERAELQRQAEQQAEAERQRAEAERQRAEAERQRAEAERQRAEAETLLRQQTESRASEERQRAEAAEQRLVVLEAELARLRAAG
jgi:Uma2 family endonuclease